MVCRKARWVLGVECPRWSHSAHIITFHFSHAQPQVDALLNKCAHPAHTCTAKDRHTLHSCRPVLLDKLRSQLLSSACFVHNTHTRALANDGQTFAPLESAILQERKPLNFITSLAIPHSKTTKHTPSSCFLFYPSLQHKKTKRVCFNTRLLRLTSSSYESSWAGCKAARPHQNLTSKRGSRKKEARISLQWSGGPWTRAKRKARWFRTGQSVGQHITHTYTHLPLEPTSACNWHTQSCSNPTLPPILA
jgi:hypothetical protein